MEKGKGGGGVVRADGDHYSLQGSQGGRGATEDIRQHQAKGGARVESKATAGPGRGIDLSASLPAEGSVTHPPDSSGAASSSKVCSITLHDKLFVSCKDYDMDDLSGEDYWSTDVDVSDQITSVLISSAAPVLSFCIDCSKWSNGTCLEKWLELLSERSVQELDVLNLGHPVSTEFPIQSVQSKKLKVFRLGFLALDLDLYCFDYRALHTLELFSCAFGSKQLSWIITDCLTLKELKIYYCYCDLHIESSSLQVVDSFGNIGSRIVIVSAPSLLSLNCGMMALQRSQLVRQRVPVSLYLNDVPMLKVIKHLIIPYHRISLDSKELTKDILPTVERLNLSLEMADSIQLQNLRKLLESFPMLQDLSVERLDGIGRDERFDVKIDEPFADLENVDCFSNCLTTFFLQEFRGGSAETHLIQSILKNARNLKLLRISSCGSVSKKEIRQIRQAVNLMKSYDRASETCQLTFDLECL